MEVWGKRGQENGPKAETNKTERATGLGSRTREEIVKKKSSWCGRFLVPKTNTARYKS